MEELIKIQDKDGVKAVGARALFEFLTLKEKFTDWIQRMLEYGFEDGKDFIRIFGKSTGGRPSIDFALTMDTAKEIAMLQRSEKGKQARQYFIECEKQLREVSKPMSAFDIMELSIKQLREQEKRITQVEDKVLLMEAHTKTRPDYFSIVGFATLKKLPCSLKIAKVMGIKAKKICRDRGFTLDSMPDPRFGKVNLYPFAVLEELFAVT